MPVRKPIFRFLVCAAAFACLTAGCSFLGGKQSTTTHTTGETSERAQAPSPPPLAKKPSKYQQRLSQYVFYSDFPLEMSDPLFRELEELPEQLQAELRLPMSQSIVQIYLFEDQEKYEAYLQARDPKLPMRRAYFFGEQRGSNLPEELIVVTWAGKHLRTDLRHELTHALLHSVLKSVPLWLDEGLAGFFEQPTNTDGINFAHLDALRRGDFTPNLARLEKFTLVEQMDRGEYQESWAWVHLMLRSNPSARKVLTDYLQTLRTHGNAGSLLAKLQAVCPEPHTMLLDHLASVQLPAKSRAAR